MNNKTSTVINSSLSVNRFTSLSGFSGNTYRKNFGGNGQGLIDIFGFSIVYIDSDSFLENGENLVEVVA
jgi:hypothetical protein